MQRFACSQGAVEDAVVATGVLVFSFQLSEVSFISLVTLKWFAMSV